MTDDADSTEIEVEPEPLEPESDDSSRERRVSNSSGAPDDRNSDDRKFDVDDERGAVTGTRTDPANSQRTTGSDAAPESDAEQLADELGRTSLRTTDDGYVKAHVTDLQERGDDTIELTVRLPTGEAVAFVLEKPIPWSEEYLFARIVDDTGYDAASVDHLLGETVLLDRDDDALEHPVTNTGRDRQLPWLARTLLDFATTEPESASQWRLVDPRERSARSAAGDDERSTGGRLLLATMAATLSLVGIFLGSIAALTTLNVSGLLVFLGTLTALAVLTVGFVCYVALVVIDHFA